VKILFLSTWFPYPPNQGSKIRAYHLLKALAQAHEITLLSFEDGPVRPEWLDHIASLCRQVRIIPRDPYLADRKKTLSGWLSARPSAVVAIYSNEMADLVREVASDWKPDCVVALTFVTAPYAAQLDGIPKVIDVDNLTARMLREAYQMESAPIAKMRRWMAYKKFERYEKQLCSQFERCLVITEPDQKLLADLLGSGLRPIKIIPNGVDTLFYQPALKQPLANSLVYNGALTYEANYDAMAYFLAEIFPLIVERVPGVKLRITGRTDGVAIDALQLNENVELTGYLDDIRPTVAESCACVVPLRMGGGTRLKILEAMALGTPVVSTTKGAEGLDVEPGVHLLIADRPDEFATQTVRILHDVELRGRIAQEASRLVSEKYTWDSIGESLRQVVEQLLQ
jgi:sugar transferase (PEP-CTERM/EpsH1 system associated)